MKQLVTIKLKSLLLVTSGTALALGFAWMVGQPAAAQYQAPGDPLQNNTFSGEGNTDPFSSSGGNQLNGVFDLFHRANLGLSLDAGEFQRQQNESINSEAENFRTMQRERLHETQPSQPEETPAVTPTQN